MDSLRARALAFRRSALYDGLTVTAAARRTYASSFADGHGPCSLCGPRVDVPADLPQFERQRRSAALRSAHFTNLAAKAAQARRRKVVDDAAA